MSLKSPQTGKENADQVEKRIKAKLKAATRNTDPRRAFICTEDVKQIWSSLDDIELVLSGTSEWAREELETIQKDYVLTLSILLLINWLGEYDFKAAFFRVGVGENKRNDEALHYTESGLEFLGRYQDNFFEKQFLFKPAILKGSDNQLVERSRRLPLIEDTQPLGSGGFGNVYKVNVAPGHFETEHGNVNKVESVFAIKRFPPTHQSAAEFKLEVDNVQLLKESLSRPQRVMLHIATIIHGNEFAILMPIADRWDLETFLYRGFNRDNGTKKEKAVYDFEEMFPRFVGRSRHPSVLYEMFAIAHALDWLHNRLDVKGWSKLRCVHTDFKPSNILICSDEDGNSPAGRWMITDFGISAFGNGVAENGDKQESKYDLADARGLKTVYDFGVELTSKNDTFRVARTQEGTYQAPESRHSVKTHFVSRRSDIWSFGCVLLEVVIFALGDVHLLDQFRNQRAHSHQLDCFYAVEEVSQSPSRLQGMRVEQNLQMKKEVRAWLTYLPQQFPAESDWLETCTDLISSTLEIEAHRRPGAEHLLREMQDIAHRTSMHTTNTTLSPSDHSQEPTDSQVESLIFNQRLTFHETGGLPTERIISSPVSDDTLSERLSSSNSAELARNQSTPNLPITPRAHAHAAPRERNSFTPTDQSTSNQTPHSTSPFSDWTPSDGDQGFRPHTTGSIDAGSTSDIGLGRRLSMGSSILECSIPEGEKIVDVCLASDAELVAFLCARHIRMFFTADGSAGPTLDLNSRVDWRQVCISGRCVAAYGIKNKRKQAFLHDLGLAQDIRIPTDVAIDEVFQIRASKRGSIAFVSTKAISILEVGVPWKSVVCPIDGNFSIQDAMFSRDGEQLFAWARGKHLDTPNRCFFWSLPNPLLENGVPTTLRGMYKTTDIYSLESRLLVPNSDQFCVVTEGYKRFFILKPDSSRLGHSPNSAAITIEDVKLACVFGNESILCIHKPKSKIIGRNPAPIREYRFALDSGGNFRIISEVKEFASLETGQLNNVRSMAALPEEQACMLVFLNGRTEIVRRNGL
ncbi:MAG: hypothetical protein Q9160_009139 [Pyrenula sp. 1 TL-2023]